jgi:hypothetical protein
MFPVFQSVSHGANYQAMKIEVFLKHWGTVLTFLFGTLGFVYATYAFVRDNLYARDDLEMSVIGEVDTSPPHDKQDQITLRLAVVNDGTRDAAVLQADIIALRQTDRGWGWDRIAAAQGRGFEAKTIKPGEIAILSLLTDRYAWSDYYQNPTYSRPIDATHHEFAEGVRIKSMDARGRLYLVYYVSSQFKLQNGIDHGPTEGYTFDCHQNPLLINIEEFRPPLAKNYDGDVLDCR